MSKTTYLKIALALVMALALLNVWLRREADNSSPFISDESDYYVPDALTGHLHRPNTAKSIKWQEHPLGEIVMKTNNMGFRNDADTKEEKEKGVCRILITGDSHTDGVVYNRESFAAVLRDMLSGRGPCEALNGGVGYYGPQNYLGFIQKHRFLQADQVIVALYLGNDFLDAVHLAVERKELPKKERPADYYDKIWEMDEAMPGFSGQCLNQAWYFKNYPDRKQHALRITVDALRDISAICKAEQAGLLVLLLPSELGAQFSADSVRIVRATAMLHLSESDWKVENALADGLLKSLRAYGIDCIDLRNAFERSAHPLYWKRDLHLNVEGHRLVAESIYQSGIIHL
ncbi:MAG: GDSL-type esterase/lipase family protein [Flavobacteriales bacterium]